MFESQSFRGKKVWRECDQKIQCVFILVLIVVSRETTNSMYIQMEIYYRNGLTRLWRLRSPTVSRSASWRCRKADDAVQSQAEGLWTRSATCPRAGADGCPDSSRKSICPPLHLVSFVPLMGWVSSPTLVRMIFTQTTAFFYSNAQLLQNTFTEHPEMFTSALGTP